MKTQDWIAFNIHFYSSKDMSTKQINHPVFTPPSDPNTKIWRYMDFTKFVSMLENKGLFFVRADHLGDPFEGSFTKLNLEERQQIIRDHNVPKKQREMYEREAASHKSRRRLVVVNCWHMNETESYAMWEIYSNSNDSVCIQSTYSKLRAVLNMEKVWISTVNYIDYEKVLIPSGNLFWPFVHKRQSFDYEKELRALAFNGPNEEPFKWEGFPKETGIWHHLNLNQLIETVFVAPQAPEWLRDLISRVMKKYDLKAQLHQSSLDKQPIF